MAGVEMSVPKTIREELLSLHVAVAEIKVLLLAHCEQHREKNTGWALVTQWGALAVAMAALLKGIL